jgi:hypothetical protein
MSAWLWPDRKIGVHESRTLRTEHNALVEMNAELLEALRDIARELDLAPVTIGSAHHARDRARAAIAKAGG